jgi:hypothetical protein
MVARRAWVLAMLVVCAGFAGAHAAPTLARAQAGGLPFPFRARDFAVRVVPLDHRLYSGHTSVPRRDSGVHDAAGVRMRRIHGVLHDLPRLQATYGLLNLNTYRITGDRYFLDRSLAQARRLAANAVSSNGAWFMPTPIRCGRHGRGSEPIGSPYYSALAQGRALLFFSRLAAVLGDERWRRAAERVFAAFPLAVPRRGPRVVMVDAGGYCWLQEWPWAGYVPDDTLNGHISAAFGIYEYYCLTGDARALELFRGAATTVLHYLPRFRQAGWISRYCLAHLIANANYHDIHVHQLRWLYTMTGEPDFARYADLFEADYPCPAVSGTAVVEPGSYPVVRLTGGVVTGRGTVTVSRRAGGRVTDRRRARGDGILLRFASGPLSGWWAEERPGRLYLPGVVVQLRYSPAREAALAAGRSYAAVAVEADGRTGAVTAVPGGVAMQVDRGAVVDGRHSVRIAGGPYDGLWLRLVRGVSVR